MTSMLLVALFQQILQLQWAAHSLFINGVLGVNQQMESAHAKGQDESQYVFKTIDQTMKELKHTKRSVLKFDIEGFEWGLFENNILNMKTHPVQLTLELHTQGANPRAVPPTVFEGKSFQAVNKLFLTLHDQGYRVISKEVNGGCPCCAEFVLVNLNRLAAFIVK